jgi:hypothetical protein
MKARIQNSKCMPINLAEKLRIIKLGEKTILLEIIFQQ